MARLYISGGRHIKAGITLVILMCSWLTTYCRKELTLQRESNNIAWDTVAPENQQLYSLIKSTVRNSSPDNLDSSISVLRQMHTQSGDNAFYEGLFTSAFYLGILHTYKGEYDEARFWFYRSLFYSGKTIRAQGNTCRALNNIGNTYQFRGDYEQAVAYYFKAIELAETMPANDIYSANPLIRIYISAANALLQLNECTKALYYLDKAEATAERINSTANMAGVLVNKGIVYAKMKEPSKAWWYNHQALALAKYFKLAEIQSLALQNIADILKENNKPASAIPYLETALRIDGNINPYYRAGVLYSLGSVYQLMKNYARAEQYLLEAYQKAEQLNLQEYLLRIHKQLAALYAERDDYHQAYLHHSLAYTLNDCLLNKEKAQVISMLDIKYRTTEKDNELLQKQLRINEQTKWLAQKNVWIAATVAGIVLLAIGLAGLYHNNKQQRKLQEKQIQLLKSEQEIAGLRAMMQGEETERSRIARELHDGLGGSLTAVKMTFRSVERNFPFLGDTAFSDAMRMLQNMSEELRETAHNLMPENILHQQLPESVARYCEQIRNGEELSIEVQAFGNFDGLDDHLVLALYRMIQELIHNTVRHASATHAIVQISRHEHLLSVAVEDNGRGFDPETVPEGAGLKNLRSRVKSLNGRYSVESVPGSGTTVYLEFDLQPSETFA
jgi:signal transduction histidine kinase